MSSNIVPTMTKTVGNHFMLSLKSNAPRLLFVSGIAGVVASTILACRATLKLSQTVDTFNQDLEGVKSFNPEITQGRGDTYSKSNYHRDLAIVYAKGTYSLVKLYSPAIIVGSFSIAALTGSHVTLTRRNAALTAAYSALQASYDSYRARVKEELGEDKERDIYQNARTEKVTIDGKTQDLRLVDPNKHSPYARFFDEGSPNWQKNPELNRIFVQCQQNYANNLLHARGHVFLNEVYDMLGIDRSQAGQVVGWVVGDEGDNYIDFGIFETHNAGFVNGWERSILLDFNVDGVVYNKI